MQLSKDANLFLIIGVTLIFFSLNSIFAKVALINNDIDAYSFSFLRVFFACLTLILITLFKGKEISISYSSNWLSSFMLFIYLIGFSYAYLNMDAGFGTLLLFGVVQLIMIISSFYKKERLSIKKLIGASLAFLGLVYLLLPNEEFELSYIHVVFMILSAIGWAVFSILGKNSKDALFNTMDNFIKATIFVALFYFIFFIDDLYVSLDGLILAILSGSLTSAVGYVLWYWVLPKIEVFTASVIQLFVPVLAILIGVIFLDEVFTLNILVSTLLIAIGIVIAVIPKKRVSQSI